MGMIRRNGRAWHGRICRFFRILNKSRAAVLHDCPQPIGSVAVATTQNNSQYLLTMRFGGRDKQRIGGGTGVVEFRPLT